MRGGCTYLHRRRTDGWVWILSRLFRLLGQSEEGAEHRQEKARRVDGLWRLTRLYKYVVESRKRDEGPLGNRPLPLAARVHTDRSGLVEFHLLIPSQRTGATLSRV